MRPILIGGCERSGTTFLGALLGAATGAITVPESPFRLSHARSEARRRGPVEPLPHVLGHYSSKEWRMEGDEPLDVSSGAEFRVVVEALVARYAKACGVTEPGVWVDHTPINVEWGLLEARRFPDARFIHLVRDGRAVAASIMRLTWGPNTVDAAARLWIERLGQGIALETSSIGDQVARVYYEDLLQNPEPTLRRLCDFCGLEFTPEMLDGGRFDLPSTWTHQHALVGKPPQVARAEAWRGDLSPRQIEIFEACAGPMLAYLGYPMEYGIAARPIRRKERFGLGVHDALRRRVINPHRDRRRWAAERKT